MASLSLIAHGEGNYDLRWTHCPSPSVSRKVKGAREAYSVKRKPRYGLADFSQQPRIASNRVYARCDLLAEDPSFAENVRSERASASDMDFRECDAAAGSRIIPARVLRHRLIVGETISSSALSLLPPLPSLPSSVARKGDFASEMVL